MDIGNEGGAKAAKRLISRASSYGCFGSLRTSGPGEGLGLRARWGYM